MISIAISGAAGRMGFTLVRCIETSNKFRLVAAVDRQAHPDAGRDIGTLAGCKEAGVKLSDSLLPYISNANVLIDFAFHEATPANVEIAADSGKPAVIGTTGLTQEEMSNILSSAARIPIVYAPNMSLGVNLLFSVLTKSAKTLGDDYSISIEETHHIHKKDAPSGTALRLGEKVAEGLGKKFSSIMFHDEEGKSEVIPEGKLPVRSYRRGEIVGDHTVIFENTAERIEFTHHAWNREAFAMGALRAAQWITDKAPGLYDMQDVLDLR